MMYAVHMHVRPDDKWGQGGPHWHSHSASGMQDEPSDWTNPQHEGVEIITRAEWIARKPPPPPEVIERIAEILFSGDRHEP